jgi:PAS domain S-box-containing protein
VEDLRYMATIAKNIQDPVISYDNDALITRWNDAAEKLLGWKSAEVTGKNIDSVLNVYYPNETRTEILISLQKNGRWKGELVYYTKTHQPVYVLATLLQLKDCDEVITGSMVIAQNITERKKAEEAIAKFNYELEQRVKERTEYIYKSEIRFRTLIENSNDIFLMLDENFKTIYCSPSSGRLTGWDDKEIINEDMLINIHSADRDFVKDLLDMAMIHPGKIFNLLFRNQHKNEKYLWLEGTIMNLLANKYIKALVVNLHDVTDRKETEEKLVKTLRRIADNKHSLY